MFLPEIRLILNLLKQINPAFDICIELRLYKRNKDYSKYSIWYSRNRILNGLTNSEIKLFYSVIQNYHEILKGV